MQTSYKYSKANSIFLQDNFTSQKTKQKPEGGLPTINFFNANPDMISKGDSSNLTWNVSSATKVSIQPGIGTVGLTGSQRIFPNQNSTYILTATNELGSVDAIKAVFVQEISASIPPASTSSLSTSTPLTLPALNSSSLTPSVLNSSSSASSAPASSAQISIKPLSAPGQLLPANGTIFDNSSSGTILEWNVVSGAANYTVEIDAYNSNSNSWLSDSAGSNIIPGINTTSYSFEFPAKGPGRWCIWAVGPDGQESKKSDWWNFNIS